MERDIAKEYLKKFEAKPIQNTKSKDKNKNKFAIIQTDSTVDDPKLKYNDSVTARIADNVRIKADGVVLFPNAYEGNLVHHL